VLVFAAGLLGCGREPARPSRPGEADSARRRAPPAAPPAVTYQRHPVGGAAALRAFQRGLSEANFRLVAQGQPRDLAHVRDRDTLAVPYPFVDELDLAPFPAVSPRRRLAAKLVLVSLRVRAFGRVRGRPPPTLGPTSTGRRDKPTPPGLYHANWKAKEPHQQPSTTSGCCAGASTSRTRGSRCTSTICPVIRRAIRACGCSRRTPAGSTTSWTQWQLAPAARVLVEGHAGVIFGEYGFRPAAAVENRLPDDPRAADVPLAEVEEALRR